jgi:nicotinamide-nucleotide amidase
MPLKIAVLAVGDELLNGELADTNTARIGRLLGAHGLLLRQSRTVADAELDIVEALLELAARHDVVLVTGGLGPTADDLTARAAARAFQRRLMLSEEALRQIRAHFARTGREMDPRNDKQALLPHKALILPNPTGSAPGFLLRDKGKDLFFLPGVPEEMTVMLEASVLPSLQERTGGELPRRERVLKVFGLAEPQVEARLESAGLPPGVAVAFGVEFPFVHAKLRAGGADAEALLDRAELAARRALADFVVAAGEQTLAGNVAQLFHATGLTVALAESCTGGLLAKLLTDIPGASAFLERGAVTYANRSKQEWLGVPAAILDREGAVSEACALAMARGVRRAAGTDLGLAITGIAGPEGGTAEKPVGTVCLALAGDEGERAATCRFGGSRDQIRLLSACTALEWLRRHLGDRLAPPATTPSLHETGSR